METLLGIVLILIAALLYGGFAMTAIKHQINKPKYRLPNKKGLAKARREFKKLRKPKV